MNAPGEKKHSNGQGMVKFHLFVVEGQDEKGGAQRETAKFQEVKGPEEETQGDVIVLEVGTVDEEQTGVEKGGAEQAERLKKWKKMTKNCSK